MLTRRDFLRLLAGTGISLTVPGCGLSPPLRRDVFPDFGGPAKPYLGLATSLREEHDYQARVEGAVPPELRGAFYRIGPGLFDRDGLRRRTILDGDGLVQSFTFHNKGVHYRNRFVRTKRYVEEEAAGRFLYPTWCTQAPGGLFANFWRAGMGADRGLRQRQQDQLPGGAAGREACGRPVGENTPHPPRAVQLSRLVERRVTSFRADMSRLTLPPPHLVFHGMGANRAEEATNGIFQQMQAAFEEVEPDIPEGTGPEPDLNPLLTS